MNNDHIEMRENLGDKHFSSGLWLFRHHLFQEWKQCQSGTLVVSGTSAQERAL